MFSCKQIICLKCENFNGNYKGEKKFGENKSFLFQVNLPLQSWYLIIDNIFKTYIHYVSSFLQKKAIKNIGKDLIMFEVQNQEDL